MDATVADGTNNDRRAKRKEFKEEREGNRHTPRMIPPTVQPMFSLVVG